MKNIICITFLSIFLLPFTAYSQDWVSMIQDGKTNVHDVEKAFYKWYDARHQSNNNSNKLEKSENDESGEDGSYEAFQRWDWYMQSRTYPSGNRPAPSAIANDYKQYLLCKATRRTASGGGNWTYAGNTSVPNNGGGDGRVNRIRFYPGNPNIMYACTPSGGLWKSVNGGSSWSTNTDKLLDLAISDIAIDPINPNIMYIGTGDNDGIQSGYTPSTIGVLKSVDGGVTWNATALYYSLQNSSPSMMTVNKLLINPDNHNIVFAATSSGLYRSPDAGVSWVPVLYGGIKDIEFEPFHSKTMFASTGSDKFYRSVDSGKAFSNVIGGLPTSGAARMAIAVTPADSNLVYLLADEGSNYGFYGLYLSSDRGVTFHLQSNSPNLLGWSPYGSDVGGQGWYTLSLAVSPTDASNVLVGGVNIWVSTDKGAIWSLNAEWTGYGAPYVHADIHQISFLPNSGTTYFAACDGGVFKTTNSGSSWSDISNDLEIAEEYSIGLSANNAGMWVTGWQDNGTNLSGSPGSLIMGGDGMVCFIDNTNNTNMYASMYNGAFRASYNGGATWNNATGGITETGSWVTRWLQDPQSPNTLYSGFNNVWKSTNQGVSWSKISNFYYTSSIKAIAVAPSNNNFIYAAQPGAMWVTHNGGTNWKMIGNNLPSAAGEIQSIAIDPAKPQRIWITFAGYIAGQKVYQSNDTGNTWLNISGGLPNLPANCVVYQPGSNDGLYVGTDMGVFYRDTILKSWVDYGNGLPNVIVYDLKIFTPTGLLRAATFGRGTWQTPLYTAPASAPVAYFKSFPQKICAGTTIQFTDTSANMPTTWNWSFAGGSPATSTLQNPAVQYANAGNYLVKLVASNINGSDSIVDSNYITVYPLPPIPVITQSVNLDTLTCTPLGMTYYEWYINGNSIGGGTQNKYSPVWQTGQYQVFCVDTNGCSRSGALKVIVAGVNDLSNNGSIKVYPNPTTGTINVEFNIAPETAYELSLTNVLGQTVYSNIINTSAQKTFQLNVAGYGKGIYFLSVKGKNTTLLKKVVVY